MNYINKNLLAGEKVIHKANIHWFIFVPGCLLLLLGISILTINIPGYIGLILGVTVIIIAFHRLLQASITIFTTELATTSKRVIAKFGVIRHTTIELNHNKVESLNVEQGLWGRIFGFGTIIINGTGGGKTPIQHIDSPLEFRSHTTNAISAN